MGVEEWTDNILKNLPTYWRKDTLSNTYGLAKSFASEYEGWGDQLNNLVLELFVETATGTYLDDLAKLFKLSRRGGETDDQLRARIKAYWPGFSGGGTKDAIISTINKITGVPETDITVTEIPNELKIEVEVLLTTPEQFALVPTIYNTIWAIKAAGVYPFIVWVINGTITQDFVDVTDSVSISVVPTDDYFRWELSLIDGVAVIS